MELMYRFRKDLDAEDIPIVLGELGKFHVKRRPQADTINKIINDAAGFIPNAVTVSSLGLKDKGDSTHFNSSSYRELGNRYADNMIVLQKRDPDD